MAIPAIIGAAAVNALSNAANSGISQSEMTSQSAADSYNTASAYNMSFGNSWTDADTANKIAQNEAEKNRIYQTYMANTAYQRAVADLKAAGLNPVLAAWNGGAASPAGTLAQTYMNSGSSQYSEGGSSSYGESHERSNSSSNSSSEPAYVKLIKSVGETVTNAGELAAQKINKATNYNDWAANQARGYSGYGYY